MPFFILGGEYTEIFWSRNWYLAAAFALVLAGLNGYFILNWRLFALLEAEDWEGVRRHLEYRSYGRKRPGRQSLRILINTYVILADTKGMQKLERHLRREKPRYFSEFGLELGLPYLMTNQPENMESYYAEAAGRPGMKKLDWVRFNLAFARMVLKKTDLAKDDLKTLAVSVADPVLRLLSMYLLDNLRDTDPAVSTIVDEAKKKFLGRHSRKSWATTVARSQNRLEVLVQMKLVNDAGTWLFAET